MESLESKSKNIYSTKETDNKNLLIRQKIMTQKPLYVLSAPERKRKLLDDSISLSRYNISFSSKCMYVHKYLNIVEILPIQGTKEYYALSKSLL